MVVKRKIDWEAIEKEYRTGQKTIRNLASEYNVSHQAISKRSKKFGWIQDKSQEVRDKTKAALVGCQNLVATQVATPSREDIEKAVQTNLEAIRQHRTLIGRTLTLASRLLKTAEDSAEIDPKTHCEMFNKISMGLAKVVPLERTTLNLDDDAASRVLKDLIGQMSPATKQQLSQIMGDK